MGFVVEYTINVHVDNFGAILISDNTLVYQHTNHIDVHHHCIFDYVADGTVKNQFFHSEKNLANSFTMSLINEPFE